jgi:SAM-dependent methyltransferase
MAGWHATARCLKSAAASGRNAFSLRYLLPAGGSYDGFESCDYKIDFLNRFFHPAHPNFCFRWADIHNTFYDPSGRVSAAAYRFPAEHASMDLVFATSVFTHMLPANVAHYFREVARILRPDGRGIFSFFLLDHDRSNQLRPLHFSRPDFNFDHSYGEYGGDFAIAAPNNPEFMTAYSLNLIRQMATAAGLVFALAPVPGLWSGSVAVSIGAQDLIVLQKPGVTG